MLKLSRKFRLASVIPIVGVSPLTCFCLTGLAPVVSLAFAGKDFKRLQGGFLCAKEISYFHSLGS